MLMPVRGALAVALALVLPAAASGQATDFAYVRDIRPALAEGAVIMDARSREACLERSIAGARCLPAEEFLGPHRRLASWRDILWLLGTSGLKGDETVLVVGGAPVERDFVAGVLYLAGCRRVLVVAEPVSRSLGQGAGAGPGTARAFTRTAVFEASMRDALVVLGHELRAMQPHPFLLDGRSEEEYWGEQVRAARGGHLPGAQSLPALRLRAALVGESALLPAGSPVVYAHDPLEGIAYFTLLRAGHGLDARVYAGGWAEWAADGALAADAVSYPDRGAPSSSRSSEEVQPRLWWAWIAGTLGLAVAGFASGLLVARRRNA
jgi:thiosulfate/3-mercaptopyruvate sulfurtransferase